MVTFFLKCNGKLNLSITQSQSFKMTLPIDLFCAWTSLADGTMHSLPLFQFPMSRDPGMIVPYPALSSTLCT